MRITFNMQSAQYNKFLEDGLNNLTDANLRVINKRNLLTPEQDATKYVGAYNIQRMIDELTQFKSNANNASAWIKNTDKELTNLIELLKKAKSDLAIAGSSSESDADSRKALAGDAASIYKSILDIANSSYLGRYIFGGFQTQNKPFTDGENEVTGVVTSSGAAGADVSVKSVFSDLPELKSGKYTAKISVSNGVGTLRIFDEKGNPIVLDSNGADQSGGKGNNSSTEITFEYKPGTVINTGRGISVKMPASGNTGADISFDYKAGSEVDYAGDLGQILAQIGYNQDISINMPGSSIFTQSYKTLQGTRFNTTGGLAATLGTLFSALDKSGSSIGDSITVNGSDHNGNRVGTAAILSPLNPKLDLSTASESERTLTVGYGDKLYKVVIPQGAYKTVEDLSVAVNSQLKKAEYVGSLTDMPADMTREQYQNYIQGKVALGNFDGEVTEADKQKYYVDISGEVSAATDGDRLVFSTSKAGDNVRLSVSGSDRNMLGFKGLTSASFGKDTVFEIGFDPHKETITQIKTSYDGLNLGAGGTASFVINGTLINFALPAATINTNTIDTNMDLSGGADYSFNVNGRQITVAGADLAAAATLADKQALINKAIDDAGLAGTAGVTLAANGANFDIALTVSDVSQKEYELAFDKALQAAGFDNDINVSLIPVAGTPGTYTVNFNMVNNNINSETSLTTTYLNPATNPPTPELQYASHNRGATGRSQEKNLGDLVSFVKNLYGDTVNVSLTDGKLTVQDTRSGESRLSLNIKGMNEGIFADTTFGQVSGNFTGAYDDSWNVQMSGVFNGNGTRDISFVITDKAGNKIFNKTITNYMGGGIELPYGIIIDPTDMGLSAANDNVQTNFTIDLKAKASLGFGDMNVIDNGSNINIFRSLKNLQHALLYDITKNGFSEPTAWKDTNLKSTAKPFLDGVFQGTFNDNWKYEILQSGGKNDMYLQNEYKDKSGEIRFDSNMINNLGGVLEFGVDHYDNVTGASRTTNVSIDLTKANPPITDAKSMQEYVLKTLNSDASFTQSGIRFTADGGKIQMESGSGTKIVNFTNNATGSAKVLTSYIMGFETVRNGNITVPVTVAAGTQIQVTDPFAPNTGADLSIKQITIPAGAYNTKEDLLAAINGELNAAAPAGTNGRIQAEYDDKGGLIFKAAGDVEVQASALGGVNPFNLGLTGGVDTVNFASAAQAPAINLSEATQEQRTLTFKYTTGTPPTKQTMSITLDKKEYASPADLAAAINEKLVLAGIATDDMKAVVNSKGELSFTKATNNLTGISVEGDHDGFLGFPKAGDEAKVKVTDAEGRVVQEVTLNTAGKTVDISDGLMLGFDKGSLKATDSFSAAVGSGVENEIPTLDKALSQVLNSATVVGNRGSRVETVMSFQDTIIKSNETVKAGYLGSTELDQVKAQTDFALATKAYESALSVVGKVMSISLLDFLR